MPIYEWKCLEGHVEEHFDHAGDRGCRTFVCEMCFGTMAPVSSFGKGLTPCLGGWPRVIHNLGHEPVLVTSSGHHKQLMKERKVEWIAPKRGMPGCWG